MTDGVLTPIDAIEVLNAELMQFTVSAWIAIGTSCRFSFRRSVVTVISDNSLPLVAVFGELD